MIKVELYGYTIYDDGTILKKNGKRLNTNQQIRIKLDNNGNTRQVNYARFVYYAFNRDFDIFFNKFGITHKHYLFFLLFYYVIVSKIPLKT